MHADWRARRLRQISGTRSAAARRCRRHDLHRRRHRHHQRPAAERRGAGGQGRQDRRGRHARRGREGAQGREHEGRGPRRQGAAARLPGRAQPLHQLADRGQPGQRLCATGRPGQGRGQHRRRAGEVPRREQDSQGRGHPGLRLRRKRHAQGPAAQPRRPGQGLARQPGAGGPRVDARRGAELRRDEEVGPLGPDQDTAGRCHRAQAGHAGALGPDHGDGLPADLRVAAAADAGAGGRVVQGRAAALRAVRRDHRARRRDARWPIWS